MGFTRFSAIGSVCYRQLLNTTSQPGIHSSQEPWQIL